MSLDELDEEAGLPDLPLLSNSSGIADSNYDAFGCYNSIDPNFLY